MKNADDLYDQLIKCNLLLADGDRQFFSKYQLTPARFYALKHIQADSGLSLSELSNRLLCTKGNATRILRAMENDGLLLRRADPTDQRAYRLELTEQGKALFDEVCVAYQQFNTSRFGLEDEYTLRQLTGTIQKLNRNLQTHLSEEMKHP
jgi:DNA-binding MarR family transcriptional regulator